MFPKGDRKPEKTTLCPRILFSVHVIIVALLCSYSQKAFFSLTFVLSQFVVTLCRKPYFLKCISLPLPYMYVFLAFFSVNVVFITC